MSETIFLSRSSADAGFALPLIEALKAADYDVLAQDHDILTGDDFTRFMDEALRSAKITVALLSESYLASDWCRREARAADAQQNHRLIPLLIEEGCAPDGLLASLVYVDVAGQTPEAVAQLAHDIIASGKPVAEAPAARAYLRQSEFITNARFDDDAVFVGRDEKLDELHRRLWKESGAAAITQAAAVHGQGGVGKTALARAYARAHRHLYRGVWEVRAETRATLTQDLAALGAALDPRLADAQDQEAAAKDALGLIAQRGGRPFLILYDNAPDPGAVSDLRPRADAHMLATSRWSDWPQAVGLDVLSPEAGAQLLRELAGRGEQAEARALSELLGHLPLALTHAGAVLRRSALLSFADYARDLEQRLESTPKGADYPASVRAALESNLAQVAADDADAPALLHIAAYLAPDAIPLELWETEPALAALPERLRDGPARAEAFGLLSTWSLITIDAEARTFSLHRLTQAVLRALLAESGAGDAPREVALHALNVLFPVGDGESDPSDVRSWPRCARLAAHAIAVLGADSDFAPSGASFLANQCGIYFLGRAEYATA